MIKKQMEKKKLQALTPLEEAQAGASLFAVNAHICHIIQDAVKTLEECETFLSTAEGDELQMLRATVETEQEEALKLLTDMATVYEEMFGISA